MNFMPPDDGAFFDEPFTDTAPYKQPTEYQAASEMTVFEKILESSRNQEKLLSRLLCEMEQMNLQFTARQESRKEELDRKEKKDRRESKPAEPLSAPSTPLQPRGALVLPPGSHAAVVAAPLPSADAQEQEQRLVETRRAAEAARLLRIEAERKAKEVEEEQRRIAEAKRIEEAKKAKDELERKTKGLMSGLLTTDAPSSLFDNDELPSKPKGGLFDDD